MKLITSFAAIVVFAFLTVGNSQASQHSKNIPEQNLDKSEKKENLGIGPVKEVKLGPINEALAKEGKNIFNTKCFACHRMDSKLVGPALVPIVKKTNPVYLMNYLLNTTEMQKKEPEIKRMIKEYNGIAMPDQYLNEKQARAVLEYMRAEAKEK